MSVFTQIPYTIKRLLADQFGRVFGAILLISGSCIGVGMLAAPILSGMAGALPTSLIIFLSWLYMTITALLLVEAFQGAPHTVNIITLSFTYLGEIGKWTAWITFISLFYSLIVAYIAKGGELLQNIAASNFTLFILPNWAGPLLLTAIATCFVYLGTRAVDLFNRICMYFLIASYFYFLFKGLGTAKSENLQHADWSYTLFIIPFFITAFGFHNMIPTVNEYLNGNRSRLIWAISISGLLICFIYIFWTIGVQSMIPLHGEISIENSFRKGEIATQPIVQLIQNPFIQLAATSLAFFAIITSLLGQSLSLFDFIADGLKIPKSRKGKAILCAIIFIPSLILSQTTPGVFFLALEFAGGVATMILFGILPSLFVWKKRYGRQYGDLESILPGGRWLLIAVIFTSCLVISYEVFKHLR